MINRLTLYTQDLAVRFNEDFSIPLTCKNCCRHVADVADMLHLWASGGIGRHAGFRYLYRKMWEFKSLLAYQTLEKTSFHILKIVYQRFSIWLGLIWTKPLGSNRYTFLQGI